MDRILMINLFVVMAGALWFVVAVGLHSQGLEQPLGRFQQFWTPLFMPAVGLLIPQVPDQAELKIRTGVNVVLVSCLVCAGVQGAGEEAPAGERVRGIVRMVLDKAGARL